MNVFKNVVDKIQTAVQFRFGACKRIQFYSPSECIQYDHLEGPKNNCAFEHIRTEDRTVHIALSATGKHSGRQQTRHIHMNIISIFLTVCQRGRNPQLVCATCLNLTTYFSIHPRNPPLPLLKPIEAGIMTGNRMPILHIMLHISEYVFSIESGFPRPTLCVMRNRRNDYAHMPSPSNALLLCWSLWWSLIYVGCEYTQTIFESNHNVVHLSDKVVMCADNMYLELNHPAGQLKVLLMITCSDMCASICVYAAREELWSLSPSALLSVRSAMCALVLYTHRTIEIWDWRIAVRERDTSLWSDNGCGG